MKQFIYNSLTQLWGGVQRSPKGGQWLTNHYDQLLIDYCRQEGEF